MRRKQYSPEETLTIVVSCLGLAGMTPLDAATGFPIVGLRVDEEFNIALGLEGLQLRLAMALAIRNEDFTAMKLGQVWKQPKECISSLFFATELTQVYASVDNVVEPKLTGFVGHGVDTILTSAAHAAFVLYEKSLVSIVPNLLDTKLRSLVNNMWWDFLNRHQNCADFPTPPDEPTYVDFINARLSISNSRTIPPPAPGTWTLSMHRSSRRRGICCTPTW